MIKALILLLLAMESPFKEARTKLKEKKKAPKQQTTRGSLHDMQSKTVWKKDRMFRE